jgi:hypothetical protein
LKEQASALSAATKGILEGKVIFDNTGVKFKIDMSIVAPAINNYEFEVVHVEHGVELYPATIVAAWERYELKMAVECDNEDEFTKALANVLRSNRVTRAIRSLIAQSRAM